MGSRCGNDTGTGCRRSGVAKDAIASRCPLMRLTVEIRLHIYRFTHEMHPFPSLAQAISWYPITPLKAYITQELRLVETDSSSGSSAAPCLLRCEEEEEEDKEDDDADDASTSETTTVSDRASDLFLSASIASSPSQGSTPQSSKRTSVVSLVGDQKHETDANLAFTSSSSIHDPRPSFCRRHGCSRHRASPVAAAAAKLLPTHRPRARLPTALLLTSRDIYAECRTIPFEYNEFVFPTWFSSGMHAAATLLAGRLAPWQRDAVRWVRLEMLSRDLEHIPSAASSSPAAAAEEMEDQHRHQHQGPMSATTEWERLCAHWGEGLQGLRLKIMAAERVWFGAVWDTADASESRNGARAGARAGAGAGAGVGDPTNTSSTAAGHDHHEDHATPRQGGQRRHPRPQPGPPGIISVVDEQGRPRRWVTHGLARLKGLRQLEVELCPTAPLIPATIASNDSAYNDNDNRGIRFLAGEMAAEEDQRVEQKLRWCAELEHVLNRRSGIAGEQDRVKVVCVSRSSSGPYY